MGARLPRDRAGVADLGGDLEVGFAVQQQPQTSAHERMIVREHEHFSGLITRDALGFSLIVGPVYAIGVALGASLFGRASEKLFRAICYALIAAALVIGLPALDRVLR